MSTDVIGKAETEVLRMELINSMVQRALRERGQLVAAVTDVSSFAQAGLDTISFPRRVKNFVVQNLVEESEADSQTIEYTNDKLLLDQHAIIAWFIKKRSETQSMVNLEADAIVEAAGEHAIDVDRKIYAAMLASANVNNDVAITGAWTTAKALEVRANLQALTKQRTNQMEMFVAVTSEHEAELLDLPRFVESDKYGANIPLISGELGRYYGMRFLVSDELPENKSVAWFRNGVVYGNQLAADYRTLYMPKKAGTEHALDQLYGVKVLDEGKYVCEITHS